MAKKVYIQGLLLPVALVNLVENGKWMEPKREEVLERAGIEDTDDIEFFNFILMDKNTETLKKNYAQVGTFMGLSKESHENLPAGFVNVNKLVVIAATMGDEMLCLHYLKPECPVVVATTIIGQNSRWKNVANSFEDFAKIIEI